MSTLVDFMFDLPNDLTVRTIIGSDKFGLWTFYITRFPNVRFSNLLKCIRSGQILLSSYKMHSALIIFRPFMVKRDRK